MGSVLWMMLLGTQQKKDATRVPPLGEGLPPLQTWQAQKLLPVPYRPILPEGGVWVGGTTDSLIIRYFAAIVNSPLQEISFLTQRR